MKSKSRKRQNTRSGRRQMKRKRNRNRAALGLEPLEVRTVLATVTPVLVTASDLSPTIESAFERVSDLDRYSDAEIRSATEWVARLNSSGSAATLASSLGISNSQLDSALYLSNTYIFPSSSNSAGIISALQGNNSVDYFYPIVNQEIVAKFTPNDPLFVDQWHLFNSGQGGGRQGEDTRVVGVWDEYTGNGVTIGVVDDGLQVDHPDLADHIRGELGYDFANNDGDPTPGSTFNSHGTAVAGVAAGIGNNALGVTGVAYDAGIVGIRLLDAIGEFDGASDVTIAAALNHSAGAIDIYNNSWGPVDGVDWYEDAGPLTLAVLERNSESGNIYTFAAGNGLQENDNSNYDGFANSPYTLAVTAVNDFGRQAYYAEPGANILISAHSAGSNQGITTTDLVGADGDNRTDTDDDPLADLDYTSQFGGTSAATPVVSGVIALMLEANPNLTYRDIQHILVRTARQNDARDADWTTNSAGWHINHKYGFGTIDAAQAVAQAETWNSVAMEETFDFGTVDAESLEIPDNDGTSATFTFTVPDDDGTGNPLADFQIEHTMLEITTDHTFSGDLTVVLTSPSGTESILAEAHNEGTSLSGWMFNSVRNWDESPVGDWTVTITDSTTGETGILESVQLSVTGSRGSEENLPVPVLTGTITGTVFDDENNSGGQNITEPGLADRLVFLDFNGNSSFDEGEPFQLTGTTGEYIFTGISAGQYQLGIVCGTGGLTQGTPALETRIAIVNRGETTFNVDFAASSDQSCTQSEEISGQIFLDDNANGIQDAGESGVEGMIGYVDLNNDCVIGLGEPSGLSNSDGEFRISAGSFSAGTYNVRVAPHPGYLVPLPCNGGVVTVTQLGTVIGDELLMGVEESIDSNGTGAPHRVVPGFHLGTLNNVDDGVFFPTGFTPGEREEIIIFANQVSVSPGYLQAWVDFNGDGDWKDAGEQILRNERLEDGQNTLTFRVPANARASAAAVRFRWGFEQNLQAFGASFGGEAEDYVVKIPSQGTTGLIATDDLAVVDGSDPLTIDVLANDAAGPLGGTFSITDFETTTAGGGTVELVDDMLVYTPPENFVGPDTFTYTITDSFGGSATATVTVEVSFPLVRDDQFNVDLNAVNHPLDVLANDLSSVDGNMGLTITSVTSPTANGGTVTIEEDGLGLLYTPASGFEGADTFDYTVTDEDGNQATGTVTTTVAKQDAIVEIRLEVADLDGNPIESVNLGTEFQLRAFTSDLRPEDGTARGVFAAYLDVIIQNSDFVEYSSEISYGESYPNQQEGSLARGLIDDVGAIDSETPLGVGEFLVFSVNFRANSAGQVDFIGEPADVLPRHDVLVFGLDTPIASDDVRYISDEIVINPFGAVNDTFTVDEDSTDNALDVLDNDLVLGENGPLTISSVSDTTSGGTVSIVDDEIIYTPAADFAGTDTFMYTAADTQGTLFTGDVIVTVTPVNDAPTAVDDSYSVTADSVDNVLSVLDNDTTLPDTGETLSISSVDSVGDQGGTVSISADGQSLLYTPAAEFVSPPQETFSYTITDSSGGTSSATVTITVALQQRAAYIFDVTDTDGNSIDTVAAGGQFQVVVSVQDLRDNPEGVFSAYLDVLYSSDLVRFEGPIAFNEAIFPNAQKGDSSVPGLIDEMGAVDGTGGDPDPSRPFHLATLTFTAIAPGTAMFNGDPADQLPVNETALFNDPDAVPPEALTFIDDSVTITGTAVGGRSTNPLNRFDVNGDALVSPLDALIVINELNQAGAGSLGEVGGLARSAAPDPVHMVDVNSDGFASPIDALLIINELQRASDESSPQAALSMGGSDESILTTGLKPAETGNIQATAADSLDLIDAVFSQDDDESTDIHRDLAVPTFFWNANDLDDNE